MDAAGPIARCAAGTEHIACEMFSLSGRHAETAGKAERLKLRLVRVDDVWQDPSRQVGFETLNLRLIWAAPAR